MEIIFSYSLLATSKLDGKCCFLGNSAFTRIGAAYTLQIVLVKTLAFLTLCREVLGTLETLSLCAFLPSLHAFLETATSSDPFAGYKGVMQFCRKICGCLRSMDMTQIMEKCIRDGKEIETVLQGL